MTELPDEVQRIRDGLVAPSGVPEAPDAYSAELVANGQRTEAIRHCKEMHNEALRHGDGARAARFLAYVDYLQNPDADDPQRGI